MKKKFAKSTEIAELSKQFVMVNIEVSDLTQLLLIKPVNWQLYKLFYIFQTNGLSVLAGSVCDWFLGILLFPSLDISPLIDPVCSC